MSANNLEKYIPSAFGLTMALFAPVAVIGLGILLLNPYNRHQHQVNLERYEQIKAEKAAKKVHTFNEGNFTIDVIVN